MYESLIREGAAGGDATSPEAVGRHRGDRRDFLRRCEKVIRGAVQRGRAGVKEVAPFLLGWAADARTLRCAGTT